MSYMSFCNFNSKSDGRRYDFFSFKHSSSLSTTGSRAKTPLPRPVTRILCGGVPTKVQTTEMDERNCDAVGGGDLWFYR